MPEKVYDITRGSDQQVSCTVNGSPLAPRNDLRNHSPTGFNFGYAGSGPAQLALAILADCCGDETALRHYQNYKFAVIAKMEGPRRISESEVRSVVEQLKAEDSHP